MSLVLSVVGGALLGLVTGVALCVALLLCLT